MGDAGIGDARIRVEPERLAAAAAPVHRLAAEVGATVATLRAAGDDGARGLRGSATAAALADVTEIGAAVLRALTRALDTLGEGLVRAAAAYLAADAAAADAALPRDAP